MKLRDNKHLRDNEMILRIIAVSLSINGLAYFARCIIIIASRIHHAVINTIARRITKHSMFIVIITTCKRTIL